MGKESEKEFIYWYVYINHKDEIIEWGEITGNLAATYS